MNSKGRHELILINLREIKTRRGFVFLSWTKGEIFVAKGAVRHQHEEDVSLWNERTKEGNDNDDYNDDDDVDGNNDNDPVEPFLVSKSLFLFRLCRL